MLFVFIGVVALVARVLTFCNVRRMHPGPCRLPMPFRRFAIDGSRCTPQIMDVWGMFLDVLGVFARTSTFFVLRKVAVERFAWKVSLPLCSERRSCDGVCKVLGLFLDRGFANCVMFLGVLC